MNKARKTKQPIDLTAAQIVFRKPRANGGSGRENVVREKDAGFD
jgi:hypothetical protein